MSNDEKTWTLITGPAVAAVGPNAEHSYGAPTIPAKPPTQQQSVIGAMHKAQHMEIGGGDMIMSLPSQAGPDL